MAISTMSAGLDNVDLPEIRKRNIPIGYTAGVLNNAVADLTVGLMIATARRFGEARKHIEKYISFFDLNIIIYLQVSYRDEEDKINKSCFKCSVSRMHFDKTKFNSTPKVFK